MLKETGVFGMKINVPDRLRVVWQKVEWYPDSYELAFFTDGTVNHIAVIHDIKAHSVHRVPLKEVREKVTQDE